VLAYLAIIDKPVARAALIELFWGDQPEDRARHSLSDTLSSLRRVLGPAAVSARHRAHSVSGSRPSTDTRPTLLNAVGHEAGEESSMAPRKICTR